MRKITHPQQLDDWKKEILNDRPITSKTVVISSGTCGKASGSLPVIDAFREELAKRGLETTYGLLITGCHGPCQFEPNIIIAPDNIFYKNLTPKDVPEIIEKTLIGGRIISRLVYEDSELKTAYSIQEEIPFYSKQLRLLTENNPKISPTRIEDYILLEGYKALARALFDMTAEEAITEISESGLRGRGGAGFPTGKKWEICRNARSDIKYIICNADEGDPGAYMDRNLMEGNPHSLIEGMIIGAYAIGAEEGYIYVRTEYPLAVEHINLAIEQAKEHGLLGDSIMGSEFRFDLHVIQGAGAFVSGEETSLMASIEGQRAFPTQKPPFPAEAGLWGRPTNINNVETWANVPLILRQGAEWYARIGTKKSKGTKIFSLVGKISNTGLVEVPMGVTLREIIYDIGGGIPDGKKFKAVQTGGPSGGCMPADLLDLQIDYDSLKKAGSMMGSGGMIVMDEDTCMVDVARYFLEFTQEESCGKCVPCRLGTRQLVNILTRITKGEGEEGDIRKLKELAKTITGGALCGLGQTAPNPVLSTLRYFEDEYRIHIRDKACPACVCKDLTAYYILPDKCVGCLLCKKSCPVNAIAGERKKVHVIDQDKCIKCGLCFDVCPTKITAVAKLTGAKKDKILKKSSEKKH
jgi:NADH:ubiquinone oxidoreductase subunit F (NADH-binding)/(2Fe-2S) ferredoxin/Pyruvate/2-oxoacid:ferredoxin oxidoreductase delta subunit